MSLYRESKEDVWAGPPNASTEVPDADWAGDAGAMYDDDAFDAAFDGDSDIEYWFWNGSRLVPASEDEAERFREREREVREQAHRMLSRAGGLQAAADGFWPATLRRLRMLLHWWQRPIRAHSSQER